MEAKNVAVVEVTDHDSGKDSIVIVRAYENCVVLGLSILTDGDIEIGLSVDKCRLVIDELQKAISIAEK